MKEYQKWLIGIGFSFAFLYLAFVIIPYIIEIDYDNPKDCINEVWFDMPNQIRAQEVYKSPNCFSWGNTCIDGDCDIWYVKCCNDEGVRYEK